MKYLNEILPVLDSLAHTKIVWPRGLMNAGGPHRRLVGRASPISIGEDECQLFGKLVPAIKPKHCFIVGNAFGLSSTYIARVMEDHGGERVITLDAESEGDGEKNAQVARALTDRLGLKILVNKKGWSPQDIPTAVEHDSYDLIFIDGCHGHPAVTEDLRALSPYAHEESVVVLHDFWFPGVKAGVEEALRQGYHCLWVPTSCEIVLATKSEARLAQLQALFEGSDTEPLRHWSMPRYALRWWTRASHVYLQAFQERLSGAQAIRLPTTTGS